jgi:FkbM family methyltransferase
MQKYEQISSIIENIKKIALAMKNGAIRMEEAQMLQEASEEINSILYCAKKLKFQGSYNLEKAEDYLRYSGEILALTELWEQSILRRSGNNTDAEFWNLYEYFKYVDVNDIYSAVLQKFLFLPEARRIEFLVLPYRYTFLHNKIDITENDFSLIVQYVEFMAESVEKYKWLYEHLADYRSKRILNGIISYWFDFDLDRLHSLLETVFPDYYDLDILQCGENDVLVDLGAYTGDSTEEFIQTYGKYKRIYAYEISPSSFDAMRQRLEKYDDIILKQNGVGSEPGVMYVNDEGCNAGNRLLAEGDLEVGVVTLDQDIDEPVTVIKMDIEGAEKAAISGAENHIRNEKPKLLVSTYNNPEDIFDIPIQIHSIRDDYKFYMRFNGHDCLWPCDYVLFAV